MVEFALVLPALMLTLLGIVEFGRLFAIYSSLFGAAREGARYGVVNPLDADGVVWAAREKISMVTPEDVDVYVQYDSGPDTPTKDFAAVTVGDRVVVTVIYEVEMITPPIRAITSRFHVETVAARTISTLGDIGNGEGEEAPPTATPDGTTTPSPTATTPSLDTPTPSATATPGGPGDTPTPTLPPGVAPIIIATPLWDGDMLVTGTAQPGELVHLRDIQDPALDLSTTVNADGTFRFDLPGPLVAGHVITVQGYGYTDYAVVEGTVEPTATPNPTAAPPSPTPTATPTTQYIDLDPTCGPEGSVTITITGHQWPTSKGDFDIFWDGTYLKTIPASADFVTDITVTVVNGSHTIMVETTKPGKKYSDSKTFEVPCAAAPTPTPAPTPSQPNLVVASVALENVGTISTYDPLTFTVAVRNVGAAAANSLFWVDLYFDPATEPPSPSDLMGEVSVAWVAVSSLAQNGTISLTFNYPDGFDTTGDHTAYALADSWDQISESDEEDNVGGPAAVPVTLEGVPPTPTPTPTPGSGDVGAISGSTWLHIYGDIVPQGRVDIYLYDGADLMAETISDQDGNYVLADVPVGTYTVIGETIIDGQVYSDIVLNVQVNSGQTTEYVTLVLH